MDHIKERLFFMRNDSLRRAMSEICTFGQENGILTLSDAIDRISKTGEGNAAFTKIRNGDYADEIQLVYKKVLWSEY